MFGRENRRLSLAVQESPGPDEKKNRAGVVVQPSSIMQAVMSKLDRCTGALKQLKNSSLLGTQTRPRPERGSKTRRSSLFTMTPKWGRVRDKVAAGDEWPEDVLDLTPDATESRRVSDYLGKLRSFESVSRALQASGDKRLNVFQARELLERLVQDYGDEFPLTATRKDAVTTQSKNFETAVYKTQGGLESKLTNQEKASVRIFLKPAREEVREDEPEPEVGYAESVLRGAEQQKRRGTSASKYRSTSHVSPTTNIVERAKSQAKPS